MTLLERVQGLRRAAGMAGFRASTIARVGLKTGLPRTLTPAGALLLFRELPKGRPSPSLLFRFLARNAPLRTGLIAVGPRAERAYSFLEMDQQIDRLAIALSQRGIGAHDAVILMLKNRAEFILLQAAIGRLGGSAVSVSWRSTASELAYVVTHSGASAFAFDADVEGAIRETIARGSAIPSARFFAVGGKVAGFTSYEGLLAEGAAGANVPDRGEEQRIVSYTSGTTGKPKGAVRSFPKEAIASTLAFIGETPMRAGDVHLAVCPLYHATAFGFVGLSYLLGATVVVLEEWSPERFLAAVQRYRVSTTAVVPTMLQRLLDLGRDPIEAFDTSSLTAIFSGGAPLSGSLALSAMDALGDKIYNFYGATETGLVTLASPADLRASPGTIGRAVPGNEIRLLDDRGEACATGLVGELFVRSAMLLDGYHADPAATQASMREGFFSVGDLAREDARGCYHLEGRKRDLIISGGVNVYPAEVEEVLHGHEGIAEAAVVGAPDREWGERVRAFVVLRSGASLDEATVKAYCRERLAGPKVPREVVFLSALPRNPTGKVLKRELREHGAP